MKKEGRLYKVDIVKDCGSGEYVESETIYAMDAEHACIKAVDDMERCGYYDDQYYILSVTPIEITVEVEE